MLKQLLKKLKYPIAAPSANISTKLSPVEAADVKEESKSKKTTTNKNDNVENVDYEVVDDEKDK